MGLDNNQDLDWLAFCYIADELDQQTRDEFEIQLSRDQKARDAVVAAMENAQRLQLAIEAETTHSEKSQIGNDIVRAVATGYSIDRQRPSRYSNHALISFAAVVLLLLTCGWTWYSQSHPGQRDQEFATIPDNLDEASAWANLLTEIEGGDLDSIDGDEFAYTDVVYEQNEDWMSAALSDLESTEEMIPELGEN